MKFFKKKNYTADTAKERLQNLMLSDDLNCSEEILIDLERDIRSTVSKYFSVASQSIRTRVVKKEQSPNNEFILLFEAKIIK